MARLEAAAGENRRTANHVQNAAPINQSNSRFAGDVLPPKPKLTEKERRTQ